MVEAIEGDSPHFEPNARAGLTTCKGKGTDGEDRKDNWQTSPRRSGIIAIAILGSPTWSSEGQRRERTRTVPTYNRTDRLCGEAVTTLSLRSHSGSTGESTVLKELYLLEHAWDSTDDASASAKGAIVSRRGRSIFSRKFRRSHLIYYALASIQTKNNAIPNRPLPSAKKVVCPAENLMRLLGFRVEIELHAQVIVSHRGRRLFDDPLGPWHLVFPRDELAPVSRREVV
ncbi:hypothetical protein BJY52DRAFT_1227853 [Lactarius psammicola]|nr:hypothetical protein BJY52DRAFT_1227853 [Lactarius psammicola]